MRKGDGVDKDMVWGRGEKREVRDGRRECVRREKSRGTTFCYIYHGDSKFRVKDT